MLKEEDSLRLRKEQEIQEEINVLIDKKQSLVFKAGAGSGKTYALIESLRYLLKRKGNNLQENNQKISVITFTNVAKNEIEERLGNSNVVVVSTIHKRLWELISGYDKQLVNIHLNEIKLELTKIIEEIEGNNSFVKCTPENQLNFIKVMELYEDVFYNNYNEKAADARVEYKRLPFSFDIESTGLLKNINEFRKLVSRLYRKNRYEKTIDNIANGKPEYTKVKYNVRLTRDRLEHMEISHDTLLRYGKVIIKDYKLLQRIIINKYPYFFVDEYQDTNQLVVDIMQILDNYSKETKHDFFVGYFGDDMQNIYSNAIGSELMQRHLNLVEVKKNLNRRSSHEVIEVINKVRDDYMKQDSIYKDASGGSVTFYHGNEEKTNNFIEFCKRNWKISKKNPLDCLFLTNKGIATYIGIPNLYNVMQNANLYSEGFGFEHLNEELLNKEHDKLGIVQKTLSQLFNLISIIESKNKTANNILITSSIKKDLTLLSLNNIINSLEKIKGDTLKEVLNSIYTEYKKSEESKFRALINIVLNNDENKKFTIEDYKHFLLTTLGKIKDAGEISDEAQDEKLVKAKETVSTLLKIRKTEFIRWYNYITDKDDQFVRYHTYHGTKGLEFKNVIIVMENRFGRTSYFDHFFKNRRNKEKLGEKDLLNFNKAQNLLYVATSRSIKNLTIYYVDCISEFSEEVELIFGGPLEYP